MLIVFPICLGLLYVICILLCRSYIRGDSHSEQYERSFERSKDRKNQLNKVKLLKVRREARDYYVR